MEIVCIKRLCLSRRTCFGICIANDISSFATVLSHVKLRSEAYSQEREPTQRGRNGQQSSFNQVGEVSQLDRNIWLPETKSFAYNPLQEASSFAEITVLFEKNVLRLRFKRLGAVASIVEDSFRPVIRLSSLNAVFDDMRRGMSSRSCERKRDRSATLRRCRTNWRTRSSSSPRT